MDLWCVFFFSSRRRHTRWPRDWSSDVCSSDLRYVHALWKGHHLILFSDVDVLTWIERESAGQPQVLPCIVRAANRKTFREIHDEIRAAQVEDVTKIDVGGAKESQILPAWLFRPYFSLATRIGQWFPQEWKKR